MPPPPASLMAAVASSAMAAPRAVCSSREICVPARASGESSSITFAAFVSSLAACVTGFMILIASGPILNSAWAAAISPLAASALA
ncbi:hypothetical protein D3C78_1827970 [compost metagenome]